MNYEFPPGTVLTPGEYLVITQAQFQNDTRLANDGEGIVLTGADGSTIREFTYDDEAPWPAAADGDGFSLVLIDPSSNPVHAEPSNWRRSRLPGGNPDATDAELFTGDPGADDDRDGLSALIEHATGSSDSDPADASPLEVSVDSTDGSLLIAIRINVAAEDTDLHIERSTKLKTWLPATDAQLVGQSTDSSGATLQTWRLARPLTAPASDFVRLRATLR